MPRVEQITVNVVKGDTAVLASLKKEAEALKKTLGSIKVGDATKSYKSEAAAAKESLKAEREATNALKARYQAEKALEDATKSKLAAQKEAQRLVTEQIKSEKELYNAQAAKSRSEKAEAQNQATQAKLSSQLSGHYKNLADSIKSVAVQYLSLQKAQQAVRYALGEMKSMSDEMVTYRKVTGATADEMERIRTAAYDTAKRYGQSPSDFLASASEMARAGYGENSVAMAELATKTQLVGDMTAEAASKFLLAVDAGYQYHGSIEKLTHVLDAANEVDNNFATSIEKISEGMTLVASLGGQAGVPIEELVAALGTMTAATQRSGGEMARALRSIFLNVLKDTSTEIEEGVTVTEENIESLSDALNKYGDDSIKAAQKAGKLINPMQAIAALAKSFKEGKLLETDLFEIGKSVAGQRYYNAFAALIMNWDTLYEPMLEAIQGSAGSADKEVSAMLDSWTAKTEQLKTTWVQMVNESISEGFIKSLIDGGKGVLEFTGSLENLVLMGGGALKTIQSLSSGIKSAFAGHGFGAFNAITAGISAAIAAFGLLKTAAENAFSSATKNAQEAAKSSEDITKNMNNLAETITKYNKIAEDGVIDTSEIETAKTLQSELNGIIGETASQYDLVNGSIKGNIDSLKELYTLQSQQSHEEAARNRKTAELAALQAHGNLADQLTGAGFRYDSIRGKQMTDDIAMFLLDTMFPNARIEEFYGDHLYSGLELPANASIDQMVKFYNDSQKLRNMFIDSYSAEELQGIGFYGDLTQGLEKMAPVMDAYISALKSENTEYARKVLAEDDYLSKKFQTQADYENYLTNLAEENDLTDEQIEALREIADLQMQIQDKSTGKSKIAEGTQGEVEAFDALTKAIKNATEAKRVFDDAMKTTKADGFNDYKSAFETFEKEIKEGRVNSTAMYAAARMMLGDEVYNAAGGTYEGVMAAMNARGAAGSRLDAYKILYGDYRDTAGNKIEGYGAYELMRQSGLWTAEQLTDKNGNPFIPDLNSADMQNLSQAWGGVLVESFVNALNALDQYDTKGEATDAAVKAVEDKKDEADQQVSEAADKASESAEQLSSEVEKVGEAAEQAGEQISQAADSITESNEKIEETAPEETEEVEPTAPDLTEAQVNAEAYLDTLTQVQNVLKEIGSSQITGQIDPSIAAILGELNSLKEAYNVEVNVGASSDTKMAASLVGGLAQSLQNIENKKKAGTIEVGLAEGAEAALKESIKAIIESTNSSEELDAIELTLAADGTQADEDITALINKQRENIKLKAEAETKKADSDLNAVAKKSRTATITAQASNVSSVESELNNLARDRQAKIDVFYSDDGTEHTALGGTFATGTRDHPGGLSLVNDGDGPELLINNGRAFIAGGGRPTLVNLQPHAKVFTASETRSIFSGNGVPAYADGTFSFGSINLAGGAKLYSETNKDKSGDNSNKGDSNNSGNGGDSNRGKKDSSKEDEEKDKAWSNLTTMMDFILNQINKTLDKQIQELQDARDAAKQQNELEKKQEAVAKAQADLADALNNRTVRYLGEDGKWHWQADARNVKSAEESLKSAKESLEDFEEETAFNEKIRAMKADFNKLSEAWEDIKAAVQTPTGTLSSLIQAVISTGSPQEATGANAVQNYLISQLINGKGIETQYNEALYAIQRATNGNPIMPGEGSIADLISQAGAGVLPGVTTGTLTGGVANGTIRGRYGVVGGAVGSVTNNNYYVNGVKIGREEANNNSLSGVLSKLGVYTNTVTVR